MPGAGVVHHIIRVGFGTFGRLRQVRSSLNFGRHGAISRAGAESRSHPRVAYYVAEPGSSSDDQLLLGHSYSNPSIDTLAVVISVGHRISVRPFATAIFCVPLTE